MTLVTRNPRTKPGKQIKPLIQRLYGVENKKQKKDWIRSYKKWCNKWETFLKERTYHEDGKRWWYTHKSLRAVRSLIKNALPDMFYYLDDKNIPKTTNGLEGRLSGLKQHYRQHRGPSKRRREAYIAWYITVVINGDLPTLFEY